ncbi:MAG: alpha/beta fold hydrolase, partial [Hyphomonas sp.]
PDFPGQGDSPSEAVPASAARYAELLPDLFSALGLESAVLLGNSIGGAAAISFAAAHPDRVTGLVLCNSGGLAPGGLIPRLYCNRMARRFEKGAAGDTGYPAWFASYYAKILSGAGADWRREEIIADGPRTARVLAEA